MIELPQIQAGELLNFLQTVYQGIPVNKQLPRSFRNVQVVFKKFVDCKQSLLIQGIDGVLLEDLRQENLTQVVGS